MEDDNITLIKEKEKTTFVSFFIIGGLMLVYGFWVIFNKKVWSYKRVRMKNIVTNMPCNIVPKEEDKCNWWFSAIFFPIASLNILIFSALIYIKALD